MTERLINKGTNGELWVSDTDYTRSKGKLKAVMEKLYKYETAEEEGRLVVLPCNLGTPVYFLRHGFDGWRIDSRKFVYGMIGEVGKTVFLTKEEAEKALKENEENTDHRALD